MTTKKIKDLQIGDRVVGEDGNPRTIKNITNGFYKGSKTLHFSKDDYACELNDVEVRVEIKQ